MTNPNVQFQTCLPLISIVYLDNHQSKETGKFSNKMSALLKCGRNTCQWSKSKNWLEANNAKMSSKLKQGRETSWIVRQHTSGKISSPDDKFSVPTNSSSQYKNSSQNTNMSVQRHMREKEKAINLNSILKEKHLQKQ